MLRGDASPQILCSVCEGNTKHFVVFDYLFLFLPTLLQKCQQGKHTNKWDRWQGRSEQESRWGKRQPAAGNWKQMIQLKPWALGSQIPTVGVVPVSTLSMGEDSEQSFQHQGERAGQQGPEGGGQGSAWRSQGPLGGWDNCPHCLAEVARPQDDGGNIQLQFDAAAIDLGVAATQCHQGCLCAKCFDVSTTVAWESDTQRLVNNSFPYILAL